jgi:hypothetical protein
MGSFPQVIYPAGIGEVVNQAYLLGNVIEDCTSPSDGLGRKKLLRPASICQLTMMRNIH